MSSPVPALLDYEALRTRRSGALIVHEMRTTYVVLGSRQGVELLQVAARDDLELRQRRGGGGIVILDPGGLWVDWWIPSTDPRWTPDIRTAALQVGQWWRAVLADRVAGAVSVHVGPVTGAVEHRVVCFAGRGPGEIFVEDHKAVGLMQWRVREGALISTQIPSQSAARVLDWLADPPPGLAAHLHHHTVASLGLGDRDAVVRALTVQGGPWTVVTVDHPEI